MLGNGSNIFEWLNLKLIVVFVVLCSWGNVQGYNLGDFESRSTLGSSLATSSDEASLSLSPVVTAKNSVYSDRSRSYDQASFNISTEFARGQAPLYSIVSIASPSGIEGLLRKDSEFKQSSVLLLSKINLGDLYSINFGAFSKARLFYDTVELKTSIDNQAEKIKYVSSVSDTGLVLNFPIVVIPNRFILATQVWGWHRSGIASSPDSFDKSGINKVFNRGIMWAVDLAGSFSINDFWLPTLTVAIENLSTDCYKNWLSKYPGKEVCGATMREGSIRDEDSFEVVDSTNLKVGAGITPRLSKHVALSIHTAMNNIHVSMGDKLYYNPKEEAKLSTGVELLFGNPFVDTPFRIGVSVNDNSFSVASSFTSEIFSLNLAYISEERYMYTPYNLYYTTSDLKTETKLVSKYMVGIKFRTF